MNSYDSLIGPERYQEAGLKRTILKFDENGVPYMKILNVPGVKTIIAALENLSGQGQERPVIVAGDLSGMGEFNNVYGREAADEAIEKALEVFVNEFPADQMIVGSPSGDEMWGVLTGQIKTEEIIYRLVKVLKKMNALNHRVGDDVVGLNGKFYVGRKSFAEVEKYLKYHPTTGKKLSAGVVVVEGALLNSRRDVVIKSKEVSDEKIIRKAVQRGDRRDFGYERRVDEKRHNFGNSPSEINWPAPIATTRLGQSPEKTRGLTKSEKEVFVDALEKESGRFPARFGFVFEAVKKLLSRLDPAVSPPELPSVIQPSVAKIFPKENGIIYVNNIKLSNVADAAGIFYELKNHDREKFITLMLNADDEILATELVSIGTLNASMVHPREVFKIPLNIGAKKLVLVHNHPSGDVKPSEEDVALTTRLSKVSMMLGIEIKYHIIIGGDKYLSFSPEGPLYEGKLQKTDEVYPVVRYESIMAEHGGNNLFKKGKAIRSPADAVEFVTPFFKKLAPSVAVVFVDSRNMVISVELFNHAIDGSSHGRLIRSAIMSNAAGYILCTNFETDDKKIKELAQKGSLSGIEMLDFIVLDNADGLKSYVSKKGEGVIREEKNIYDDDIRDKVKEEAVYSPETPIELGQVSVGEGFQGMKNRDSSSKNYGGTKSTKEAVAMIKVADNAAKGSYVAKITGVDEKYGIKREFLCMDLSWTKKKGIAELSIKPDDLAAGDIIALKIAKTPEDKEAKEHFYRVVSEPADNIALHSIVKKIPGGLDEVKKMLDAAGQGRESGTKDEADILDSGIKFDDDANPYASDDDLIVTKGSMRKSYVAVITGADEDGRLKRNFVSFYKDGALRVASSNVKMGDIVAMKIIRKEQQPGEAKECYYKIIKEPADENQMHKIVQKITRDDVVSHFAGESEGASKDIGPMEGENEDLSAEISEDFVVDGEGSGDEEWDECGHTSGADKARGRGRRM